MAVAEPGVLDELIGGSHRRLVLRNAEIERFEVHYAPLGIFELADQLFGKGQAPQVRHVRDLVALALVGGGMKSRAADDVIAALPPSENLMLRDLAFRLIGVTFFPVALDGAPKKKGRGSRKRPSPTVTSDMTPPVTPEPSAE